MKSFSVILFVVGFMTGCGAVFEAAIAPVAIPVNAVVQTGILSQTAVETSAQTASDSPLRFQTLDSDWSGSNLLVGPVAFAAAVSAPLECGIGEVVASESQVGCFDDETAGEVAGCAVSSFALAPTSLAWGLIKGSVRSIGLVGFGAAHMLTGGAFSSGEHIGEIFDRKNVCP